VGAIWARSRAKQSAGLIETEQSPAEPAVGLGYGLDLGVGLEIASEAEKLGSQLLDERRVAESLLEHAKAVAEVSEPRGRKQ
jgi:hypothetical protein